MKNETKREALQILANAPTIAARAYLQTLPPTERAEAARLFKALGLKLEGEPKKES